MVKRNHRSVLTICSRFDSGRGYSSNRFDSCTGYLGGKEANLDIGNLWFTQRTLKRSYQIKKLIAVIEDGGYFDKVLLQDCPDGEVEILNGHHRIIASWRCGWLARGNSGTANTLAVSFGRLV